MMCTAEISSTELLYSDSGHAQHENTLISVESIGCKDSTNAGFPARLFDRIQSLVGILLKPVVHMYSKRKWGRVPIKTRYPLMVPVPNVRKRGMAAPELITYKIGLTRGQ